jgi:hypothetical protein
MVDYSSIVVSIFVADLGGGGKLGGLAATGVTAFIGAFNIGLGVCRGGADCGGGASVFFQLMLARL